MTLLSRLTGFKPIIIDLTRASSDGDEHPSMPAEQWVKKDVQDISQYSTGVNTKLTKGFSKK